MGGGAVASDSFKLPLVIDNTVPDKDYSITAYTGSIQGRPVSAAEDIQTSKLWVAYESAGVGILDLRTSISSIVHSDGEKYTSIAINPNTKDVWTCTASGSIKVLRAGTTTWVTLFSENVELLQLQINPTNNDVWCVVNNNGLVCLKGGGTSATKITDITGNSGNLDIDYRTGIVVHSSRYPLDKYIVHTISNYTKSLEKQFDTAVHDVAVTGDIIYVSQSTPTILDIHSLSQLPNIPAAAVGGTCCSNYLGKIFTVVNTKLEIYNFNTTNWATVDISNSQNVYNSGSRPYHAVETNTTYVFGYNDKILRCKSAIALLYAVKSK